MEIFECVQTSRNLWFLVDVKTIKNSHILKAIFYRIQAEKKFKERLLSNKSILQILAVSDDAEISTTLKIGLLYDALFLVGVKKIVLIIN